MEKRGYICRNSYIPHFTIPAYVQYGGIVLAKSAGGLLGETRALQHVQEPDGRQRATGRVDI